MRRCGAGAPSIPDLALPLRHPAVPLVPVESRNANPELPAQDDRQHVPLPWILSSSSAAGLPTATEFPGKNPTASACGVGVNRKHSSPQPQAESCLLLTAFYSPFCFLLPNFLWTRLSRPACTPPA